MNLLRVATLEDQNAMPDDEYLPLEGPVPYAIYQRAGHLEHPLQFSS